MNITSMKANSTQYEVKFKFDYVTDKDENYEQLFKENSAINKKYSIWFTYYNEIPDCQVTIDEIDNKSNENLSNSIIDRIGSPRGIKGEFIEHHLFAYMPNLISAFDFVDKFLEERKKTLTESRVNNNSKFYWPKMGSKINRKYHLKESSKN